MQVNTFALQLSSHFNVLFQVFNFNLKLFIYFSAVSVLVKGKN